MSLVVCLFVVLRQGAEAAVGARFLAWRCFDRLQRVVGGGQWICCSGGGGCGVCGPVPGVGGEAAFGPRGEALALLGFREREGGALRALRDLAGGAGGCDQQNL